MVIEWNAHLFSADLARYPFHPEATYRPRVETLPADPLGEYLRRMRAEGIDRAVVVHPEPYGDDHRLIVECLRTEPQRLRGTCLFYPKDPAAAGKLAELVAREPRIVALRFHAHRGKETYLDDFADLTLRRLWQRAVDLGLMIELHIGPNYARQAASVLRTFPESRVLIDHLAEPHLGNAVEFADVLDLARFPHVWMKLSGLDHFANDGPLFESAIPFTRPVIQAFGPDRLLWGGGTPRIVDVHMPDFNDADRAKVRGGNLARLLKWD
jgi:predicted TIM-barrel fold metal-dependent hydrolase